MRSLQAVRSAAVLCVARKGDETIPLRSRVYNIPVVYEDYTNLSKSAKVSDWVA